MPPDSSDILDSDFDDEHIRKLKASVRDSENDELPKGKYKCTFENCDMSFTRMELLDRHEYTHTGIKKHVCTFEDCTKRYKIMTHLKRHIARFHEKKFPPKNFPCKEESCDKKFRSLWDMEKHFKNLHENLKPYSCKECGDSFRRKMQLRRHMIKHTGVHPFKCDDCNMGFLYRALWEKHDCLNKKYTCKQCSEEFKKWSELVSHRKRKVCTMETCEICSKRFKSKNNLRDHKKIHVSASDRMVFPCTYEGCPRFYFQSKNLNAHIKSCHEKRSFKCTQEPCESVFTSETGLKKHIKMIHNTERKHKKDAEDGKRKVRARRKDFGKKKNSFAVALSGVQVDPETEKLLIEGKGKEIELCIDHQELESKAIEETELVLISETAETAKE